MAGISVWDRNPGAALDEAMAQFRQRVQNITTGPPTMEHYEVLAEA